jgi:hypothetical protein
VRHTASRLSIAKSSRWLPEPTLSPRATSSDFINMSAASRGVSGSDSVGIVGSSALGCEYVSPRPEPFGGGARDNSAGDPSASSGFSGGDDVRAPSEGCFWPNQAVQPQHAMARVCSGRSVAAAAESTCSRRGAGCAVQCELLTRLRTALCTLKYASDPQIVIPQDAWQSP